MKEKAMTTATDDRTTNDSPSADGGCSNFVLVTLREIAKLAALVQSGSCCSYHQQQNQRLLTTKLRLFKDDTFTELKERRPIAVTTKGRSDGTSRRSDFATEPNGD